LLQNIKKSFCLRHARKALRDFPDLIFKFLYFPYRTATKQRLTKNVFQEVVRLSSESIRLRECSRPRQYDAGMYEARANQSSEKARHLHVLFNETHTGRASTFDFEYLFDSDQSLIIGLCLHTTARGATNDSSVNTRSSAIGDHNRDTARA
jgi:hypothetical protein